MTPAAAGLAALLVAGGAAAVEIVGSDLVLRDAQGAALDRAALIGAVLDVAVEGGGGASIRVDAILTDPWTPGGDVTLYALSVDDGAGGWEPACAPDAEGARLALLQPAEGGGLAIWCTAGALAKCVRFGYRPWARGPGGAALEPYWRACVKMVRADYCGDDPTTRDGMLIDFWDRLGVHRRTPPDLAPGLAFEAAWGPEGALCVAHPRVPQHVTLGALARSCPRLAGRLGPACAEAAGDPGAALLFNASRGDGLPEPAR